MEDSWVDPKSVPLSRLDSSQKDCRELLVFTNDAKLWDFAEFGPKRFQGKQCVPIFLFLSLSTVDIQGQITSRCVEPCCALLMVSSLPVLFPRDASSTFSPPGCNSHKCPQVS